MAERPVIADAGPLISIARIEGLSWLHGLLPEVLITGEVAAEVLVPGKPAAARIAGAIEQGWVKRFDAPIAPLPALEKFRLDPGEASVLACAHALGGSSLVILDDLDARRAAAELGIRIVGTLGLAIDAKRHGLVASFKDQIDKLVASGFYVSPQLVEAGMRLCGEDRAERRSDRIGRSQE